MSLFIAGVAAFFWVATSLALRLKLKAQPGPILQELQTARRQVAQKASGK